MQINCFAGDTDLAVPDSQAAAARHPADLPGKSERPLRGYSNAISHLSFAFNTVIAAVALPGMICLWLCFMVAGMAEFQELWRERKKLRRSPINSSSAAEQPDTGCCSEQTRRCFCLGVLDTDLRQLFSLTLRRRP